MIKCIHDSTLDEECVRDLKVGDEVEFNLLIPSIFVSKDDNSEYGIQNCDGSADIYIRTCLEEHGLDVNFIPKEDISFLGYDMGYLSYKAKAKIKKSRAVEHQEFIDAMPNWCKKFQLILDSKTKVDILTAHYPWSWKLKGDHVTFMGDGFPMIRFRVLENGKKFQYSQGRFGLLADPKRYKKSREAKAWKIFCDNMGIKTTQVVEHQVIVDFLKRHIIHKKPS